MYDWIILHSRQSILKNVWYVAWSSLKYETFPPLSLFLALKIIVMDAHTIKLNRC